MYVPVVCLSAEKDFLTADTGETNDLSIIHDVSLIDILYMTFTYTEVVNDL